MLPSFQKKEVLTFRCFSRKGYALFACLHREVRIGVLSAATLLSAAPRLCAGGAQLRATDVRPDSATTRERERDTSASGRRAGGAHGDDADAGGHRRGGRRLGQ